MEEGIVIPIEADDSQFFASMKNIESAVKQGLRSLDKFSKATKNMTKVEFAIAKTDQMDAVNKKIAETIEQMGKLAEEISELQKKANSPESSLADILEASIGVDDKRAQIKALEKRQMYLQTFASGLGNLEQGARVKQGGGTFDKLKSVLGGIGKVAGTAGNALKKAFSGAVSIVGRVASGIKGVVSSIAGLGKRALSAINPLKSMFGAMLGAQSVYGVLRKAVSAYMADNEELSARLTNLWSGLGNLIGPIIDRIVSFLARGISYLTQFLALFGGVAKKAKAAGGAAKKAKDVLQIDELNKLSDDSGGGGGGADPSEYEMPEWLKDMAELLKAGEWEKAGTLLADKLNEMVNNVDWAGLGQKIGYYMNGALTFLATAIEKFDWNNLGAKIAEFINNMFSQIDFTNLGTLLAAKFTILIRVIGGLLENIDPSLMAEKATQLITGFYDAITRAVQSVNWSTIGQNIATFFSEIDLSGVFQSILGMGQAIVDAVNQLITTSLPQIATAVVGAFNNVAMIFTTLIPQIITIITNNLPTVISAVVNIILIIGQTIIDNLPVILDAGVQIVVQLAEGIANMLPELVPQAVEMLLIIAEAILKNLPQIIESGIEIILALIEGLIKAIPVLIGHAPQIIESLVSTLIQFLPQIISAGIQVILALIKGLIQAIPQLIASVPQLITALVNGFANGMRRVMEIGRNLVAGIWQGLSNATGWLYQQISSWANNIISSIKNFFGIASPSKLMRDEVGKMIAQGIGVGFTDEMDDVKDSMQRDLANITSEMAGTEIQAPQISTGGMMPYSANGQESKLQDAIAQLNISNRDVITAVLAIGEMIVNAVNNKDTVVELDGKQISETVTRMQRQAERAMG